MTCQATMACSGNQRRRVLPGVARARFSLAIRSSSGSLGRSPWLGASIAATAKPPSAAKPRADHDAGGLLVLTAAVAHQDQGRVPRRLPVPTAPPGPRRR